MQKMSIQNIAPSIVKYHSQNHYNLNDSRLLYFISINYNFTLFCNVFEAFKYTSV